MGWMICSGGGPLPRVKRGTRFDSGRSRATVGAAGGRSFYLLAVGRRCCAPPPRPARARAAARSSRLAATPRRARCTQPRACSTRVPAASRRRRHSRRHRPRCRPGALDASALRRRPRRRRPHRRRPRRQVSVCPWARRPRAAVSALPPSVPRLTPAARVRCRWARAVGARTAPCSTTSPPPLDLTPPSVRALDLVGVVSMRAIGHRLAPGYT